MSDLPKPTEPRLAATILLLRDGADGLEVFMVVRHQQIDFASGALVFPGGKLAPGDGKVRGQCRGVGQLGDAQVALRVGAIREAFEESGLLLARAQGSDALLARDRCGTLGERYRTALDHGDIGIGEMLEAEQLELATDQLVPFAHWITPTFMAKRFDTYFYLAQAPADQLAAHDGREAVDSEWLRPQDAIRAEQEGSRTIVPATLLNIEKLARSRSVAEALEAARAAPVVPVTPWVVAESETEVELEIPADADYNRTRFSVRKA